MQFHLVLVILAIIALDKVTSSTVPLFRYWNGVEHFYTTDVNEIGTSKWGETGKYNYKSEDIACYVYPTQEASTVPLYRYWNGREHFYTTDVNEIGTNIPGVTGKYGYQCEGVAGYVMEITTDELVPLHRYWNGIEHFYTTNIAEIGTYIPGTTGNYGYQYERVAGYVYPSKVAVKLPLFRYWNGVEHFYTTNIAEIGTIKRGETGNYGYQCEGVAGYVYSSEVAATLPLFRYWNGRDHFYTTDIKEIGTSIVGATGNNGYQYEGVAGYVYYAQIRANVQALYRYWNGVDHFYTSDIAEIGTYVEGVTGKYGYKCEGAAAYVNIS